MHTHSEPILTVQEAHLMPICDAGTWALCTLMLNRNMGKQSYGGEGKSGFISLSGKEHSSGFSRTRPPSLGNRERSCVQGLWSGVGDMDQGSEGLASC